MKFSKRKMMAIAAASMVALAPMTAKADENGVSIRGDVQFQFQFARDEFESFEREYGERLAPWLRRDGVVEEIKKFLKEPDNLDLCGVFQRDDVRRWRFRCFEKERGWVDLNGGRKKVRRTESRRPEVSEPLRNFELILKFVERFKLLVEETGKAVISAETESQKLIDKEKEEANKTIAEAQKEKPLTLTEEYVSEKLREASKPIVDIIEEEKGRRAIVATNKEKPVVREKLDHVKSLCAEVLKAVRRARVARENLDRLTGEVAQIKKAQEEALARKITAVAKAKEQLNVEGILAAENEYTEVEIKRIRSELALKLAKINEGKAKAELEQKKLNLEVELRSLYAELRKNPIPCWLLVDNRRAVMDKFFSCPGSTLIAILENGGYSFECYDPQEWRDVLTGKPEERSAKKCLYNEAAFLKFVDELALRM